MHTCIEASKQASKVETTMYAYFCFNCLKLLSTTVVNMKQSASKLTLVLFAKYL
jgi:hypothetical protein